MKRMYPYIIALIIFLIFSDSILKAQYDSLPTKTEVPSYKKSKFLFSVGESCSPLDANIGGGVISSKGLNLRAGLYMQEHVRIVAEWTHLDYSFPPVSNAIHYDCYEVNIQFMGHLPELNTELYLLGGLGVQHWEGSYIAVSDKYGAPDLSENLNEFKGAVNFGLGAEKHFNDLGIFGEFKLRVGEKSTLSTGDLIDALYSFGIKYDLTVKKKIKNKEVERYGHKRLTRKELKGKPKANGGGKLPGSKYDLDLIQK